MPRQNILQSNFTAGEVSPKIAARLDTKLYANGLKTCENMIVLPQGGATRRGGFRRISTVRPNSAVRLVEFEFSDVEAYVLEFGEYYIRFYTGGHRLYYYNVSDALFTDDLNRASNGGLTEIRADADVDLPSWNIASVGNSGGEYLITTTTPHTLRTGAYVQISGVTGGGAGANGDNGSVAYVSPTSFRLAGSAFLGSSGAGGIVRSHGLVAGDELFLNGTGDAALETLLNGYHHVKSNYPYDRLVLANVPHLAGTWGTGEYMLSIPVEVLTTYAAAQLSELRFAQSADVLYILHPDHPVRKLTRIGASGAVASWTLSDVDFEDGPYLPLQNDAPALNAESPDQGTNQTDVYLQLSNYTHAATVKSASNFTDATDDDGSHYLEYREGDQWRLALVTAGGISASALTTATVSIIENVLLHLDETTKFRNTVRGPLGLKTTYDAGSPNASPSVPQAGVRNRADPNNYIATNTTATAGIAGTLTANYSNTFGVSDVGKFVRFFSTEAVANVARIPVWARIRRVNSGLSVIHEVPVTMVTNGLLTAAASNTGAFVVTNHSRTATVTAYKAGATFALFNSTDVGRHIRLAFGGRWTWGKITGYTSTSVVTVTFYADMPRDPHNASSLAGAMAGSVDSATTSGRTYDWRLGAWSGTTGYPSAACFHEQRLVFGRTDTQPQTFWGSVTGDFENFAPTEYDSTVLDDNAYTYTLASGKVNAIKWLESGTNLVIGTNGGEWLVRSTSATQEPITPTNISVMQQSRNGSSRTALPLRVGSSIVFVSRSEMNVMDVSYLFSEDRLQDKDLTVAAEHIIRQAGTVVQCAYQQNPHMIGWYVLSDGTLAALTYNAEQEVIAWHRHTVSGGTVESVAIIPNEDGSADDVYVVVNRTISGAAYRTVEVLTPQFYSNQDAPTTRLGMTFMDGCVADTNNHPSTSLTTITGLDHLEGLSVIATVAGTKSGTTFTVTSGAITLTVTAGQEYVIGLAYTPIIDSLPIEGGSQFGTAFGMKKRVIEMKARVFDTCEFDVYPVANTAAARKTTYNKSTATAQYFTGTVPVVPQFGTDTESAWRITTDKPYALTVLGVALVLETTE